MLSLSFIKEIEKIIGRENVLTGEADRQNYAYDAAVLPPVVPGLVVRPTRTDQLGPLIQKCYEEGIPITIRGSGTNLSGGTIPDSTDAVIILTNSLDRILEINEEEMYAVVEPGVITCDLAAAVAARGLFYPPDPGSMSVSTMGGNIAENSGGLHVSPKTQAKGQTKVTYHESCHLQKSLGVSKQPRDLIRMNPGYNLVEMAEANRCCGCGGSFTLTHYDLSLKMGQRKRDNVIASGAEVVATGCPACMMQLSDMLARNNDPVQVKHTIEIYAESLPL